MVFHATRPVQYREKLVLFEFPQTPRYQLLSEGTREEEPTEPTTRPNLSLASLAFTTH